MRLKKLENTMNADDSTLQYYLTKLAEVGLVEKRQ